MITKYSIDLRQFNNGESEKITFPYFDQCLMYGILKLKSALKKKTAVIQALLIEDSHGRKIVVTPTLEELEAEAPKIQALKYSTKMPSFKVVFRLDPHDGDAQFIF